MAHEHSMYDGDTHFKIDPVTRAIENTTGKTVLMQGDHNSEIFTFELPKTIDGHDMGLCNDVTVYIENTEGSTREKKRCSRKIEDLSICPDCDDVVICSWTIDEDVTYYAGTLSFSLCFACVNTDGTKEYAWNTASYDKLTVQKNLGKKDVKVERTIRRGSTPTQTFTIPFDTSTIDSVIIIYAQNKTEVFRKTSADCTITDDDISVILTQEDTLSLSEGDAEVQMIVKLLTDKVLVTDEITLFVEGVLSEDVAS